MEVKKQQCENFEIPVWKYGKTTRNSAHIASLAQGTLEHRSILSTRCMHKSYLIMEKLNTLFTNTFPPETC